jgi:hypothetical protein
MRRRRVPDSSWAAEPDPLLALVRRDLAFYARASDRARRLHHGTELGALLTTSVTVVAAGLHAPAWLTALIAGGAVFFTGLRQLYGAGSRWVPAARQALQTAIEEVGANELRAWSEAQSGRPEPPVPSVGA